MRIDILCTDGSPIGVTLADLWGEGKRGIGVGGSEYALLTMCEAWQNAGHDVVLYNSPSSNGSPFEQRPREAFDPNGDRDVIITFRTPNPKSVIAKGLKVWWSCDQYTSSPFESFAGTMDKIVTISPRHRDYFLQQYGIRNSEVIDLAVRLQDIQDFPSIKKIPKRCLFTSVPDRGLMTLSECWKRIKKEVPDVSLVITSDYRLWGVDERNERHRVRWMIEDNVEFLGAVKRERLIEEQLKAELLTYPSDYDELFCVAVAEAQACGVYPITSNTGALPTTNMGTVLDSNDNFKVKFTNAVIEKLLDPNLKKFQDDVRLRAFERFSLENILRQWDEKIFNG